MNRQYTDNYFRTGETGVASGKADFVAMVMNRDWEVTKLEASDVKIRVYGNVAIVTELVTSAGHQRERHPLSTLVVRP